MADVFIQRTPGQTVQRQLIQSRPNTVTATQVYSPGDGVQTVIKQVFVCKQSAGDGNFSIFHDNDGTTYNESTALFWQSVISANATLVYDVNIFCDSSANVAVRSETANAITFSFYGEEVQVRAR